MLVYGAADKTALRKLLARFALRLQEVPAGQRIPGSYWGDSEAGLGKHTLHVRADTPVHSLLHEACHYICMDRARRSRLDTDAGGDDAEENAVCYLQVALADYVPALGRRRIWADMDAWGYGFRLGSAQAWFERDALDAADWLIREGLLDHRKIPTWRCRQQSAAPRAEAASGLKSSALREQPDPVAGRDGDRCEGVAGVQKQVVR